MKVETLKEIVNSVENETAMSLAMLKVIESGKLEESNKKGRRGYTPDSIENVVTWLEETYDELKAFVPFRYWNSSVLDKQWLKDHRDEIEIRFATGGVFIRLSDFKRFLEHSIKESYTAEYLEQLAKTYDEMDGSQAVSLGFGKLDPESKYAKAFGDRQVKVTRSGLYAIRTPIELVDSGTAVCMGKLLQRKHFDFDTVKSEIERKSLLEYVEDGYVSDMTNVVYRIDPKYNYVTVRLVGDVRGEQVNKRKKVYTQADKDQLIKEFLASKKGGI